MSYLSGSIQRPLVAAAAVIAASVSADVSDKFSSLRSLVRGSEPEPIAASVSGSVQDEKSLWVSHISASKLADLSFMSRIRLIVPNQHSQLGPLLLFLMFRTNGICPRLVQLISLAPRDVRWRRIGPSWFCWDGLDRSRSI
ncbi:BnaC05g32680D [Brassica napus]|uniref:BnaC05g32680D protein n=1 Tax=Brassica napus TaxID=3708 RepID=A0A078GH25_BRANA|nr:BnaC05g32680D [Brassica napus]